MQTGSIQIAIAVGMGLLFMIELAVLWKQYEIPKALVIPVIGFAVGLTTVLAGDGCSKGMPCVVDSVVKVLSLALALQIIAALIVPRFRFESKLNKIQMAAMTFADLGDYGKAAEKLRDCIGFFLKYRYDGNERIAEWARAAVALDTLQKIKVGILKLRMFSERAQETSTSRNTYYIDFEVFKSLTMFPSRVWTKKIQDVARRFLVTFDVKSGVSDAETNSGQSQEEKGKMCFASFISRVSRSLDEFVNHVA